MTYLSALYTCGTRQMSAMDIWNRRIWENNYCWITLLVIRALVTVLTSSPTQNSPAVCFRIGSRAGGQEGVTAEKMWEWKLSINVLLHKFHQPWKPRSMKCWAHGTFSAPIFWITCRFWKQKSIILIFFFKYTIIFYSDRFCSHLQRLYPRGNDVTYHPSLGTFLWVSWKQTRPRTGLVDILDHCQLCESPFFFF